MASRRYDYVTVDVFTDRRFCGNPLAVFPRAEGLSEDEMLALAREFNFPETTFVLPPADRANTARVRIFTPGGEMPFAGHPNVGTAFVLAALDPKIGNTQRFEEIAGNVVVELLSGATGAISGARVAAPQPLRVGKELAAAEVAACCGLRPEEIRTETHAPILASVGLEFVFAEVADRATLSRALPDLAGFRAAVQRHPEFAGRLQLHLYVRNPAMPDKIAARMFAPLLGVAEDPATGSANAALAALLAKLDVPPAGNLQFDIEQGREMGRLSHMVATADVAPNGEIRAKIAGRCVRVFTGQVDLA